MKSLKTIAGFLGIGRTEMVICEPARKIFVIANGALQILQKIRGTAEGPLAIEEKVFVLIMQADMIAEKIIRIAAEVVVITTEISGATGRTDITTKACGIHVRKGATIIEVSGTTGDSGVIIKAIYGRIAKFDGTSNGITPQGLIRGTGILPSVTGISIPVNHSEKAAGEKHIDVKVAIVLLDNST